MRFRSLLLPVLAISFALPAIHSQAPNVSAEERASFHRDPDWAIVAPHLPDPKTATAAQLEMAGDVLRARRFPEDALDYYGYAIQRGGNVSELLNKMGVVRLDLHQNSVAREMFLRTVRAQKRNAQGWNNLGVTEYSAANYQAAIADYNKAARIEPKSAVYHSNLGMAYFAKGDVDSARAQFSVAVMLDPHMFDRTEGGGATIHVVGSTNYSGFALQMARVYARRGERTSAILWISKSAEAGGETRRDLENDDLLRPYLKDVRVIEVLRNVQQMRARSVAVSAPAAPLAAATDQQRVN